MPAPLPCYDLMLESVCSLSACRALAFACNPAQGVRHSLQNRQEIALHSPASCWMTILWQPCSRMGSQRDPGYGAAARESSAQT